MIKTDKVIIVEGKYDKIKLSSLVDGVVITTDGFAVMKNDDKTNLIRRLAEKNGIVILTDSDAAGFRIRGYLNGILPKEKITNLYIPDIYGKERRKVVAGKEGKLGVEGMPLSVLENILSSISSEEKRGNIISPVDLYLLGFSGGKNSSIRRKKLLKKLNLPEHLSAGRMCEIVSAVYTREEFLEIAERITDKNEETEKAR
ncbi:MAG: DUF4093 domain-containing protein [Oscillospiraceae bacterium]|nr:DUF4093 domain-containing protein [Oscillospiraceae bacterium]